MQFLSTRGIQPAKLAGAVIFAGIAACSIIVATSGAPFAQTAKPKPAPAVPAPAAAPAPAPAPAPAAAAPANAPPEFQLVKQLREAGVKACLPTSQALGAYTMNGVSDYAVASTWNSKLPDERFVSAVIGQKFAGAAAAPLAITSIFSAPNKAGKCDGAGVQIIPSALACPAIQAQVLQKGKSLGDLAGIPLLQDSANARVMLLPSAGNGCVIVGFNNFYSD